LWFIHLPSHILQSKDRAASTLRSAYELLNKFQKTGVHLLTDEVCFIIPIFIEFVLEIKNKLN